jgi:hypothetical protein
MAATIPEVWHIYGLVTKNGQPFTQANIRAFDKYNGVETYLGETGLSNNNGNYTITYSRSQFQKVNPNRTAPNVIIRIIDYQNKVIYESPLLNDVVPEFTYNIELNNQNPEWKIEGTITIGGQNAASGSVSVIDIYNSQEYNLGSCQITTSGQYSFTYQYSQFQHGTSRPYPKLIIKIYNASGVLLSKNDVTYPPSQNQIFNVNIPETPIIQSVSGTIINSANAPVNNITVTAKRIQFQNGNFTETELGRDTTNEKGNYLISYNKLSFPGTDTQFSLLIVVSIMENNALKQIAKSNVRFNAGESEIIDLVVDAPSTADISNVTEIINQLNEAGFSNSNLIQMLTDSEKLEYASNLINKSQKEVYLIANAFFIKSQLIQKLIGTGVTLNRINEQIIYAILKTGNANNYQSLRTISPKRLHTILVSAITQGIVPPQIEDSIVEIINEWKTIFETLLTITEDGSSEAQLLDLAGFSDESTAELVRQCYSENAHSLSAFWNKLDERLSSMASVKGPNAAALIDEVPNRLKTLFNLFQFADEFMPLVNKIVQYIDSRSIVEIAGITHLEKSDWIFIVNSVQLNIARGDEWPDEIPGETDAEKRSNYARILFKRCISWFPMARFRYEIGNNQDTNWNSVRQYLGWYPEYDFVDPIITVVPNINPSVTINDELYGKLMTLQRMYRLTPRFNVINSLIARKYTSAISIAHISADEFIKNNADITDGVDDALALHCAAVHTASQTLFLMGTFNQQSEFGPDSFPAVTERMYEETQLAGADTKVTNATNKGITTGALPFEPENTTINKIKPNIATLFGNQNQCKCPECQSVFSPSAYMVDLMEFMGENIRNKLFRRRPDLAETELSCRNSNGMVHYIDIVNEVLENAVCKRNFYIFDNQNQFVTFLAQELQEKLVIPAFVKNEFNKRGFPIDTQYYVKHHTKEENNTATHFWYIIGEKWRYLVTEVLPQSGQNRTFYIQPFPQTGKDAEIRRALPDHLHPNAYKMLENPVYPYNLPLNLSYVEINKYLHMRNSKRYELYHTLHESSETFPESNSNPRYINQCRNFLELTPEQYALVANTNTERPWELWGLNETEDGFSLPGSGINFTGEKTWYYLASNVAVFLNRTGYDYDQLLDLLLTSTVNGDGGILFPEPESNTDLMEANLSKIWIRTNGTISLQQALSRIARFIRLCHYTKWDMFVVDRIAMLTTDTVPLSDITSLYKVFRIAHEFKVNPYQAASWYTGKIDNVNLGRGPLCQLEEIFISRIINPARTDRWRILLNDLTPNLSIGFFEVGTANDKYANDIGVLTGGMKINYDDLSAIAYYEFDSSGDIEDADANTILASVSCTLSNLGKMYRVADFAKALGVSILDFYIIQNIITRGSPQSPYSLERIYQTRDLVRKIRQYSILPKEIDYFLTGNQYDSLTWVSTDDMEVQTIIKINQDLNKFTGDEKVEISKKEKETVIIKELAKVGKTSDDIAMVFLKDILRNIDGVNESLLEQWVRVCDGGWNVDFYSGRNFTGQIPGMHATVKSINKVVNSENSDEQFPASAHAARWTATLFVKENGTYQFIPNLWLKEGESGNPGTMSISITRTYWEIDPNTGESIQRVETLDSTNCNLLKDKYYFITVEWVDSADADTIPNLNAALLWKNLADPDAIASLVNQQNVIYDRSCGLELFVKNIFVINKLMITSKNLAHLGLHHSELGMYSFNSIPTRSNNNPMVVWPFCSTLFDIVVIDKKLSFRDKNASLFSLWDYAYSPGMTKDSYLKLIGQECEWNVQDIREIANRFAFNNLVDFRRPTAWKVFSNVFPMLKRIGITAGLAYELVDSDTNTFMQSETLRNSVQQLYSKSDWITASEKIQESIRIQKRDALLAYLLGRRKQLTPSDSPQSSYEEKNLITLLNHQLGTSLSGAIYNNDVVAQVNRLQALKHIEVNERMEDITWNLLDERYNYLNAAAVYAHYLIDIQMGSEVKTTRIVQANGSILLLIQRALLNLEKDLSLSDKITHQWTWMRNYRLWEANRKIFLYPENWLEPEFRDDKTPLFKELESALWQKELTSNSVDDVVRSYTSSLHDLANLEVIGSYQEESMNEKVLHIVARTYHYPHTFYYRKNYDNSAGNDSWTPWEKIDLDITADVVVPIPFRNKVYLFWPIIELKEKSVENEKKEQVSFKYFELKLAWSEYSNGNWSAKRLSTNALIHEIENIDHDSIKPEDLFHLKAEVTNQQVEIHIFAYKKVVEKITVVTKKFYKSRVRVFLFKFREVIKSKEETTTTTNEIEGIIRIACFTFGLDNSAKLFTDEEGRSLQSTSLPAGSTIRHNSAEENPDNQNKTDFGALEYPKTNILLKRTPDLFRCFPTNLSFIDNSFKPFFFQESERSFLVKPVPLPVDSVTLWNTVERQKEHYQKIINFYHPMASELLKKANFSSIDDLLTRATQTMAKEQYPLGYTQVGDQLAKHLGHLAFAYQYLPSPLVVGDYPLPMIDFAHESAYGVYNWELFFHLPLLIAQRLSNEQKFQDALKWFHYIFNPGNDFSPFEKSQRWIWTLPDGARYWNFLPFFSNRGVADSIYKAVTKSQVADQDTKLGSLIEEWKNDPFKPHLIARLRIAAYQKSVIMKYLDNLVNWGDMLFRLDNMESINEATNLYVYASEILGDKPKMLPSLHDNVGLTYTQLKLEGLDQFSNAFIQLENYIPPAPPIKVRLWRSRRTPSRYYYYHYYYGYNQSVESIPQRSIQLLRMAPAMYYFCIPKNDRLLSYWDTVGDRLFKIRNSLDINGIKREIPLFAPPIDPGLLARAAAAGIDIGSVIRDMQTPVSYYRFQILMQKATELCNELKSFGAEILSALEKLDAEKLSLLRNEQEIEMYKLISDIKLNAVKDSQITLDGLKKTREMVELRYNYYKNIKKISDLENAQLLTNYTAGVVHTVGQIMTMSSAPVSVVPDFYAGGLIGLAGGALVNSHLAGGEKASGALSKVGNALIQTAGILDRVAGILGTHASYQRRWEDWKLQERLANKELEQLDKQIAAAEIKVKIAEYDLRNQEKQIEQASAMREVMESKFTNEKMYQWMADQLVGTYNKLYDLAYKVSKKAEKAYQFEVGLLSSSFVTPEIWDSTRKGLLAGQRLMFALRQMDNAYMDTNKREMEITRAISLKLMDPVALLTLRETGTCFITIPEELFDFDYPGHYFRRIKSVRVTIPCITGPYTNINATLKLTRSKTRVTTDLINGQYMEQLENNSPADNRFLYNPVPPMSVAISNAQMDSGMFEFNFRDERYLPFEGAGVISEWELALPGEYRQFDYATISDVVLHISYTSRDSGMPVFIDAVKKHLAENLQASGVMNSLISLKMGFATQYASIVNNGTVTVTLDERYLNFLVANYIQRTSKSMVMQNVSVYVLLKNKMEIKPEFQLLINETGADTDSRGNVELQSEAEYSGRLWKLSYNALNPNTLLLGEWLFSGFTGVNANEVEDIYLYFEYSLNDN